MAMSAESSLESMSSEQLKQLLAEQTSAAVAEPAPVEEKAEAEETEQAEEAKSESTEETPSKEETTEETKAEESDAKVRKIKVEGKEIEIPAEKELEYIQKGYHYEKKMAELKAQREELAKLQQPAQPAPLQQQFTREQIIDELKKRFDTVDNAIPTIFEMIQTGIMADKELSRQERRANLQFELEKSESVPHWDSIKSRYEILRDLGESREQAFLKAENDYYKSLYVNAHKRGVEEGSKKADLKQKAQMPGVESKSSTRRMTAEPSLADLQKMSARDLAKMLPRTPELD